MQAILDWLSTERITAIVSAITAVTLLIREFRQTKATRTRDAKLDKIAVTNEAIAKACNGAVPNPSLPPRNGGSHGSE